MNAALLWLVFFNVSGHQSPDRYFKEDHLTGADYILLAGDGTYCVTGREHLGIWVLQSGRWERSADGMRFERRDGPHESYSAAEGSHRGRRFLSFKEDAAPGLAISIAEITRRMDSDPKTLPPYVFFEVDRATYERETNEPYPFRTREVEARIDTRGRIACGNRK